MKQLRRFLWILIAMMMVCFVGCTNTEDVLHPVDEVLPESALEITEDGQYTGKEEVAAYIHSFGHLPDNFISKTKAKKLGWDSKEGNLWDVAPGMSIGGSRFQNYDGTLPDKKGRTWTECDIDYAGGFRGAKRMVFSDDGLIYYTEDHYQTFEQLY